VLPSATDLDVVEVGRHGLEVAVVGTDSRDGGCRERFRLANHDRFLVLLVGQDQRRSCLLHRLYRLTGQGAVADSNQDHDAGHCESYAYHPFQQDEAR
jgi:hypothetical protein